MILISLSRSQWTNCWEKEVKSAEGKPWQDVGIVDIALTNPDSLSLWYYTEGDPNFIASSVTLLVLFAGIFVRLLFQQTAYWTWQHEARPYPWTEWTKQLCQPNKKPKGKTSNPENERKMKMEEHNSIHHLGFKRYQIEIVFT